MFRTGGGGFRCLDNRIRIDRTEGFFTVSVVGEFVLLELVFGLEEASAALALVLVVGAVTGLEMSD